MLHAAKVGHQGPEHLGNLETRVCCKRLQLRCVPQHLHRVSQAVQGIHDQRRMLIRLCCAETMCRRPMISSAIVDVPSA